MAPSSWFRMQHTLAALVMVACQNSSAPDPGQSDGFDLGEDLGGGKADSTAVQRKQVNEPLQSGSVRELVCEALQSRLSLSDCDGLTYTVTEIAESTVYKYKSGASLSLELKVAVDDPARGATYAALLKRQVDDDYRLRYRVDRVDGDDALVAEHKLIKQLMDDAGEYPDWTDPDLVDRVRTIDFDQLPALIQDAFERTLEDHQEYLANSSYPSDAAYSDESPFLEIVENSRVIGYVLSIDETVDHPLWDGSGTFYYFDRHADLIDSVYWSG